MIKSGRKKGLTSLINKRSPPKLFSAEPRSAEGRRDDKAGPEVPLHNGTCPQPLLAEIGFDQLRVDTEVGRGRKSLFARLTQ